MKVDMLRYADDIAIAVQEKEIMETITNEMERTL